ncbi:hypothetical protein POVWA2_008100 [Plasmodium ovale wallikeri]|uniref:Uncharacterized protein n=1 Tax=Plasmodium ovale wallikeri TaxID=864142 RepID=A0A1A8YKV9_PLAOA|nr:hypothetical protein POVWA2_008100 [Plasmodium ovale wallikeri]
MGSGSEKRKREAEVRSGSEKRECEAGVLSGSERRELTYAQPQWLTQKESDPQNMQEARSVWWVRNKLEGSVTKLESGTPNWKEILKNESRKVASGLRSYSEHNVFQKKAAYNWGIICSLIYSMLNVVTWYIHACGGELRLLRERPLRFQVPPYNLNGRKMYSALLLKI